MNHSVLIVDDEPVIRNSLQELFSREPYSILTAGSAREALDLLAGERWMW